MQEKDMNNNYYIFNDFLNDKDIDDYINDSLFIDQIIKICLCNNFEIFAIHLMKFKGVIEDKDVIECAIRNSKMKFLKFIWEDVILKKNFDQFDYLKKLRELHKKDSQNPSSKSRRQRIDLKTTNYWLYDITISDLVRRFCINKNYEAITEIISKWKSIEQDKNLLTILFEFKCFEEISNLIWHSHIDTFKFTKEQFRLVIENEQIDLILYFIKIRECRIILEDFEIQKNIVENYMLCGSKIYYGAEMLIYIYKLNWNNDLTKKLCTNIMRTIKTKEILNCHSPVLTCLLLTEFLDKIGNNSVEHSSRCEKLHNELLQFCLNIQESNQDENYINFLMTQEDSRNRSSLQIASENSFYRVLQTAEIGTIVKKMWNGNISNNGFFSASSMFRYLDGSTKINDPFNSFDTLDTTKNYFFQFFVWKNSCSLRYWPESISTVLLIIIYNTFIYLLVKRNQNMNSFRHLDSDLQGLLLIYIIWVICINFNIINLYIFGLRSKRKFILDNLEYLEISLLFSAFALLFDIKYFSDQYITNDINSVFENLNNVLIFPISKNFNVKVAEFNGSIPFLIKNFLLVINEVFVWLRITGILLTFKDIGPLIRMIYLMSILLIKNLVLYGLYVTCCSAIFTAIFHSYSSQFQDFSTTIVTLIGGFMNNFETENFNNPLSRTFGSISIVIYVCISGVLLINLLIALLSNVYENYCVLVDASHRSVLISFYRKFRWDEENGYLIFLTTPLNIINFLILPFSYFFDKKKFNENMCKFYYCFFYFPLIFAIFILSSIFFIPFCYLKGMIYVIGYMVNLKIAKYLKIVKIIKWLIFGFFYLFFIYIRDIIIMLKKIFYQSSANENITNRIKKYIAANEVVIFLKFIHNRKQNESKDIHSLFMDYLNFEQKKKAENDKKLKEKTDYLHTLNSAMSQMDQKKINRNSTIVNLHNKKNAGLESKISSMYIKKNLIIIEILENFLIDEGFSTGKIDIEKLKMLLPKTMNIDDSYIKKLIHTDISSLNKAINQLKNKKNLFLQYQILNKIVQNTIRLDKEIDFEILKNLNFSKNADKEKKPYDENDETNKIEKNESTESNRKCSNIEEFESENNREILKFVDKLLIFFYDILCNKR